MERQAAIQPMNYDLRTLVQETFMFQSCPLLIGIKFNMHQMHKITRALRGQRLSAVWNTAINPEREEGRKEGESLRRVNAVSAAPAAQQASSAPLLS